MALNPHFLQGSRGEQRLVQSLINEHLKIYGVEVTFIPRKFVNQSSIIEEVQASKFDDNFLIEAYVENYDGYAGAGDVLTKFGMSLRDEVTLTISKERFEEFIAPFMDADEDIELSSRPREGDLVFFPLGQRLFEIKFVEHEEPFYQLGSNYVYKLKCELFEYEDEVIDTSIEAIDTQVEDDGYIAELQLVGVGRTAQATAFINTGYIREIFLNNDGHGYTSTPTVAITTSPSSADFSDAKAVAFTTERAGMRSVEKILLTQTGFGYTEAPTVSIPITSLTNHRERVFLNDSPAITRKIINKILTNSGFSAAYLRPSISGTFFSTLGIGSGTFHKAHAAKIGSKITIPIPMLAKISDIFPEVEKSWNIKIAANILLIESDSVIP